MNRREFMSVLDSTNPMRFFSLATNRQISPVESNAIDELSSLGLPQGVINAIIDYSLRKNSGRLIRAYIVKLGATAKLKGFKNAESEYGFLVPKKPKKEEPKSTFTYDEETFESAWLLFHTPPLRKFPILYSDLTEDEKREVDQFDLSFDKPRNPEEISKEERIYTAIEKRLTEKHKHDEESKKRYFKQEFLKGYADYSKW